MYEWARALLWGLPARPAHCAATCPLTRVRVASPCCRSLVGTLEEYEAAVLSAWTREIEATSEDKLKQPLLRRERQPLLRQQPGPAASRRTSGGRSRFSTSPDGSLVSVPITACPSKRKMRCAGVLQGWSVSKGSS